MSNLKNLLLGQLETGAFLFDKFTSDLSDEEYFKLPVPNTNHVAWNVGHIAVSEDSEVAAITGGTMKLSDDLRKIFSQSSECAGEPSMYPSRRDIDEMYNNVRANTTEQLKMFDEKKWDDASPEDWPTDMFPTLGSMWSILPTHQFWHIGQITVCRQSLGKSRVLGAG